MESSTNPSSKQRILCFKSQQSISWQSNQRWSENLEVQITLTDALLSSGWLRSHFTNHKGGATDFIVLLTIVMHARPLRNADLTNLIQLSLAGPQDEGRFYARITDIGLADELGIHRSTVAKSACRLSSLGFLSILEIPKSQKPYRDSHGLYAGTKIYLLAGEIEQTLPKTLQTIPCIPHDFPGKEKENWEGNSSMSVEPTDCVSLTGTNIRLEDRGEEVFKGNNPKMNPTIIFDRFAELRGSAYHPNEKDLDTLITVALEGYTTEDVLTAIQRAASNLKGSLQVARTFGYILPEIRRQPPNRMSEVHALGNSSNAKPDGEFTVEAKISPQGNLNQIPENVTEIFNQVMHRVPTTLEKHRLHWLHEALQLEQSERDGDAWEQIAIALKFDLNPKAKQPIAYLRKVFANRDGLAGSSLPANSKPGVGSNHKVWIESRDSQDESHLTSSKQGLIPGNRDPQYPTLQVGSWVLTRPKERPSGFVFPAEENMRNLYDFAAWKINQETTA